MFNTKQKKHTPFFHAIHTLVLGVKLLPSETFPRLFRPLGKNSFELPFSFFFPGFFVGHFALFLDATKSMQNLKVRNRKRKQNTFGPVAAAQMSRRKILVSLSSANAQKKIIPQKEANIKKKTSKIPLTVFLFIFFPSSFNNQPTPIIPVLCLPYWLFHSPPVATPIRETKFASSWPGTQAC